MKEIRVGRFRLNLGLTKEVLAVIISVISFLVSMVTVYFNSLQPADISFIAAPYIRHVVDDQSRNEAFFIPLTLVNRGARPGSVLSFELALARAGSAEQQVFYAQYFAQDNAPTSLGAFFTPITLEGHSSGSFTLCFYPPGRREGNFFAPKGTYRFQVTARIANVSGEASQTFVRTFDVTVDESRFALMQSQPDGEYVFPIPTE